MYQGIYRTKSRHPSDLHSVLERSWNHHLHSMIVTAGTLDESKEAIEMTHRWNVDNKKRLFCTVGVHPTRCDEFGTTSEDVEDHCSKLKQIILDDRSKKEEGVVVAMGEMGLDYDRLEFCSKEQQRLGFTSQLKLASEMKLPLFLHNRNTGDDLHDLLREHSDFWTHSGGVVHSFDDTAELATKFIDLGLYIGINGCSLKKTENLEVVRDAIPLDRMLLETDCPWCDVRATHAGYEYVKTKFPTKKDKQWEEGFCVKNRTEPCHVVQVAEIVAGLKGVSVGEVAEVTMANAVKLFGLGKKDG